MKIAVAVKVVPDDQFVHVAADRSLDYSKAPQIVSLYDLSAIEVASRIVKAQGGTVTAITAGPAAIDDSKLRKNILARVDDLTMIADDACAGMDAYSTADVLADAVRGDADISVILCGDGSADNYAQQVDVQLAAALGWPVVNAATQVDIADGKVTVVRMLEDEIETVEVTLPAVISVTPDAAQPRIVGMKDILAAGKKPVNLSTADGVPASTIEIVECLAPEAAERKCEILDAADGDAIKSFAAAIKAAL